MNNIQYVNLFFLHFPSEIEIKLYEILKKTRCFNPSVESGSNFSVTEDKKIPYFQLSQSIFFELYLTITFLKQKWSRTSDSFSKLNSSVTEVLRICSFRY